MTRIQFWILKSRKAVVVSFWLFCFSKTPYFETKLEECARATLSFIDPNSSVQGLKFTGFCAFHLDELTVSHPLLGLYELKNLETKLKFFPLLLGKIHIKEVALGYLKIHEDPNTIFSPTLFNALYRNKKLMIDKAYFIDAHLPLIKTPLAINFHKKQTLSFLQLYDKTQHSSVYLEISRVSDFLKFKLESNPFEWPLFKASVRGEGFINETLGLDLKVNLSHTGSNLTYPFDVKIDWGKQLSLKGLCDHQNLFANLAYEGGKLKGRLEFLDLKESFPKARLSGHLKAQIHHDDTLKVSLSSSHIFYNRKALYPLDLCVDYESKNAISCYGTLYTGFPQESLIKLSQKDDDLAFTLSSKDIELEASLSKTSTYAKLQSQDFSLLNGLFDDITFEGKGMVYYLNRDSFFETYAALEHVKAGDFSCDKAYVNVSSTPQKGEFNLQLKQLETPYSTPLNLSILGEKDQSWDLISRLESGKLKLESALEFSQGDSTTLNIREIKGVLGEHKAHLDKPIFFEKSNSLIKLSPFNFKLAEIEVSAAFEKTQKSFSGACVIKNLPLSGIKIPYFDSALQGLLHLNASLDPKSSSLNASIDRLELKHNSSLIPPAFLNFKAELDGHRGFYELKSLFASDDYIYIQGQLPCAIDPETCFRRLDQPSTHTASIKIDLKDLGRLINMGSNSLGGHIHANLNARYHRKSWEVYGKTLVSSLHMGFPLLSIYTDRGQAEIEALGKTCNFRIQTEDLQSGQAKASGVFKLSTLEYDADVDFDRFFVSFKKLFNTQVMGKAKACGDFKQIKSTGKLYTLKPSYELQAKTSAKQRHYLIEKPLQDLPSSSKTPFCFDLNYDVKTKEALKIKGVGLDSEWMGKAAMHISNNHFGLEGKLELKKGDYKFNGKKFLIDEGVISLSEKSPSTILAKGRLNIPSHEIKVNLCGPLSAPKLQFSSIPMLEEHAIFSYILFNKPASELHPFQSLELAQTLMELSGDQTPFSLAKLKSTLSIDTLDISSGGGDKKDITLHIGKYIRPGFLVGLNQSSKKSDMLLELELKHGFLIKAESKDQKQGKFSLKWRRSF